MAAYVIVDVEITDPEPFKEYQKRVPETIARHGGRYLARGGKFETLEGNWQPKRIVIIEFPSFERAKAWYTSPEYQALLPTRERHARINFLTLVDGA